MAEKKKLSIAGLLNEIPCPDELVDAKDNYVQMAEIVGKEIEVKAFAFFTSKDTTKYNQGNEKSVHFMFTMGDKLLRTATHSKRIVRGFETLEKATGTRVLEFPVSTKIIMKDIIASDGAKRQMYEFEF